MEDIQKQILQNVKFVQQELIKLHQIYVKNVIRGYIQKKDGIVVHHVELE